jgi:ribonuclease Z
MHRLFEAHLTNDTFGDPGVYVDFRDDHRALLLDLGDIAALPPRKLMRITHAFVTHTHMDHFSGFDHLLRVVLGRKESVVLYGGPGFVDQVEHKLRAYTWNVVHRYDMEFVIEARCIAPDGSTQAARFSTRRAFAREPATFVPQGDVLHDESTFRVRARFVDHDIACLSYALEEKAQVKLARDRIEALGLGVGAWLRELKHAILGGAPSDTPIPVRWRDRDGDHETTRSVGELSHLVLEVAPGQRIGYVTDLRYTPANVEALSELLGTVDRLFIECVFLDADREHGARKNHLTARQAGEIARRVGAKDVVPFHFSPRYEGREQELVAEMRAAWDGAGWIQQPAPTPSLRLL